MELLVEMGAVAVEAVEAAAVVNAARAAS
ncbi:hypothetical protein XAP6164_4270002 [Xanthomonas phaseoli pv. phaseoli]|nr:hypothetical protein XAP6164_4270002 [Xanthomonas phaseoli pv. phaseoli]